MWYDYEAGGACESLLDNLYVKAERPETVVAAEHGAHRILHPSVGVTDGAVGCRVAVGKEMALAACQ